MFARSRLSQLEQGGFSLFAISINWRIKLSGGGSVDPSFNIVGCLEINKNDNYVTKKANIICIFYPLFGKCCPTRSHIYFNF